MQRRELPEAERTSVPNPEVAKKRLKVEADLLTWMAVHGNLLLALRHPENTGESRRIVAGFVEDIGRMLVVGGIINQEELEFCRQDEEKAGGRRH